MKLAVTTENKLGITDDVLSILREKQADLIKLEVGDGKMFLQTQDLDKSTQGMIASLLMKIPGVKWVNQIDVLPMVEQQNMLDSLLESIPDPVMGINTKGQIAYANKQAKKIFKSESENNKMPSKMKSIFCCEDWQEKINAAGSSHLPVTINTIAGKMLLDVQATKSKTGQMTGAMLHFRNQEKVMTSGMVMQGEEIEGLDALVYQSQVFEQLLQRAKSVASVEAPLCLIGEAGTGKTLLAHACHKLSDRKNNLFTTVDCQAVKAEELEQMLFGTKHKLGILELNETGTIYFSHLEYMSLHVQHKLFKLINRVEKQKARIITSSAKRLHQYGTQMDSGLVSTLDILRLDVPALRDRKEDIEPLTIKFVSEFSEQTGKQVSLSLDAISRMKRHYWPGNVSQLRNSIYKAVMVAKDGVIKATDLDLEAGVNIEAELEGLTLPEAVNEFEKHFLQHWYQKYPSSRKLAAQLGVSHTTIAQKINKYKLNNTVEQ
ncbi:TyrR/PhhR family helix-turn-helix DNA-binding protein [Marinicella rhabdoformis]|uniref:TyrR/PhhR family helix-turn-helix DNA-binding protein n=1 Tax=Marinicella rhabdoformis TaxID=2580566 RepID=UPI0012AEC02B|nr:TyrR/PhhR family helix-turn-helix DNA-binding protein [Marinicella rhabdoformis]